MTANAEKSFRSGIENPHLRGQEKRREILLWLAEYQYSTITIMSQFLGLNSAGQWAFFNRLIDTGLLHRFGVPTVGEKIFLLTREGKELAAGLTEKALNCITEPARIPVATVRHNLCVQRAVLERLKKNMGTEHTFERHLYFTDRDKLPDALLTFDGQSTALEIELSHKNTNRIFRAFFDHIKAMQGKYYYDVEYVFCNETLCQNYLKKFNQKEWPRVERSDGRLRQTGMTFEPDTVPSLKDRFRFVVQDFDKSS